LSEIKKTKEMQREAKGGKLLGLKTKSHVTQRELRQREQSLNTREEMQRNLF